MKKLLMGAIVACILSCHATPQELQQTFADASKLGGCIIGTILGGITDPKALSDKCAGALPDVIVDVVTDFEGKITTTTADAGLQVSAQLGAQRALLAEAKAKAIAAKAAAK